MVSMLVLIVLILAGCRCECGVLRKNLCDANLYMVSSGRDGRIGGWERIGTAGRACPMFTSGRLRFPRAVGPPFPRSLFLARV